MKSIKRLRKFLASLGPVEQSQIVVSITVIVTLVTIVAVRKTNLEWLLFGNVLTVGVFGFIIVFFTLKYGRLLEEQKQELLSLNTFAESVNRAIDVQFLLQNALYEMRRLLNVEYGWIYRVEGDLLLLKATRGTEELNTSVIDAVDDLHQEKMRWIYYPRIATHPEKQRKGGPSASEWEYGSIGAWASVPIMMKDQISGLIVLASKNPKAFSYKQIDFMMAFANQIGVALENATLFERVRKSEERYIDLFEHSPDMSHIINRSGIITSCNQTEAVRLGYQKNEIIGQSFLKLYSPEYHQEAQKTLDDIFERNVEVHGYEEKLLTKSGELIEVSVNASIIRDEIGHPMIRAVARDITEKKNLEAKVIHAQRIDSIGNLAGGVAHDFNNILTSILGSTAIMKRKMKTDDPWFRFADIIETAARRGAGLTRQLLTFARKGHVLFRPVVVNEIIEETLRLFERSIDKRIIIEKNLTNDVCVINGDDGQLQQSLLNLLINARDAMPDGGTITIQSEKKFIAEGTPSAADVQEGEYIAVTIIDTGLGIDKEVQQHIFDPFFTTKDRGKGTGLGLSVVYGVVNSHNGFITVQSEPMHGSQFTMFFPIIAITEKVQRTIAPARLKRGTEHAIIVDDESDVAKVIGGMLESLGYQTTIVDSGRKALALFKKGNHFDFMILDLNMPKISGKETFEKLRKINTKVPVIISSGYSDRDMDVSQWPHQVDAFLQKPYTIDELSKTIRLVLDNKHGN